MEQLPDPNFLYLLADTFQHSFLVNLSMVRMVTDMGDGQCTLYQRANHLSLLGSSGLHRTQPQCKQSYAYDTPYA